jgi:hypothetical protein
LTSVFLVVFVAAALYQIGYMFVQWDEMPHSGGTLLLRGKPEHTTYGYYPLS